MWRNISYAENYGIIGRRIDHNLCHIFFVSLTHPRTLFALQIERSDSHALLQRDFLIND